MMKNVILIAGALALSLCGARQAMAEELLNLLNPPAQSDTPYALSFTAGSTTTDIQFEGYQVPSEEWATDISLTNGGGNLLGETWTYTPAPSGALASQNDDGDGTGTNGVYFAGVVAGDYDQFDQLVTTVIGQSYTLDFLFSNSFSNEPSGFIVSASDTSTATATPEPSSMFLFGSGLLGVMIAARRRRRIA
jgi:PEP-CTERM motif